MPDTNFSPDELLQPSDEEVLDYDDDQSDSEFDQREYNAEGSVDDENDQEHQVEEDEGLGGWGPSKKDYYNADAIETEQDALDEEAEALRIQKKQLQSMTEADFGFDEDEWVGRDKQVDADSTKVVTEVLPQLRIEQDMPEEERLKLLRTRYPEFEPITHEYAQLQPIHDELAAAANAAARLIKSKPRKTDGDLPPTPMAITKYRACAAYIAAMSMYFAVLGSTAKDGDPTATALDPTELHHHPVMESLLQTRTLWRKVESLPVGDPMVEATLGDELSVIEEASPAALPTHLDVPLKPKRNRKTKAQRAAEAIQSKSEARRAEKLRQTEADLASLNSLTGAKSLRKKKPSPEQAKLNLLNAEDSDFGEETSLTAYELAEKLKKKKSLRFYTSQIAQKANKRDAAGRDAGGDADVPHRERLKDRQARLQAQAEKRGQDVMSGPGVALGEDGDSDTGEEQNVRPGERSNGDDFEDADGYYDLVAARSNAKKQAKSDRAAAYAEAAASGGVVVSEEVIGEDGRRQISYAIEKNKGLTPRRAKQSKCLITDSWSMACPDANSTQIATPA